MDFDTPPQPPTGPEQGSYIEYGSYYPLSGPPTNPYNGPQNMYDTTQRGYQPYGPEYGYGYGIPVAPLPLSEAINQLPRQYWKVTTRPGAMTFAQEAGKARWDIIWVQLIGYAFIVAILGALGNLITQSATTALLSRLGTTSMQMQTQTMGTGSSLVANFFASLVGTFIGFFIIQGIYFGLAKAFGGQGTFTAQAYTFLLFQVPIGIVVGLLALIPVFGSLLGIALNIYGIVLSVFAIMGTHRLGGGKASAVVLIPVGVLLLLVCALVAILFAVVLNNPNFH